jgi:uncharacterized membrane protein
VSGEHHSEPDFVGLRKSRLESLSDGIFAVAMTLLVFILILPHIVAPVPSDSLLWTDLWAVFYPGILVYALVFLLVGMFWLGQHAQFHYIVRTDRFFTWITILFLMVVVLLPLSATLLAVYPIRTPALVFFGVNVFIAGLLLIASWRYAVRYHFIEPHVDEHVLELLRRRALIGPVLSGIAVLLAFIVPVVSLTILIAIPVLYLIPSHLDEHYRFGDHAR